MTILVTGGAGFIGQHLVARLYKDGVKNIRILDDGFRNEQPEAVAGKLYYGDIRNPEFVDAAVCGVQEVIHLAYINGTKNFYESPDLVLDVAVKGIVNLLDACKKHDVKRFMLVSSSEVCRAAVEDMSEAIPLVIPDPYNPRYSYSAGKIISEMLTLHCKYLDWMTIIRPFNIYGPRMRLGHVIPDFKLQLEQRLTAANGFEGPLSFTILGSGQETRSFCYIDDFIDGMMLVRKKGEHRGIYNIGTEDEITISDLAQRMGLIKGRELRVTERNKLPEGSITRRRPDISRARALGYSPKVSLDEGLWRVMCQ